MRDAIGSPAYSTPELMSAPEPARSVADAELIQLDRLTLEPARTGVRPTAPTPQPDSSSGEVATPRPPCLSFEPSAVSAAGGDQLTITVPGGGLLIRAGGGGMVAVRRFGQELHQLGTIAPDRPVRLSLARDTAPQPWHVQLQTSSRALLCGE